MNRTELLDKIAADTKLSKKDADSFLKSFIENVSLALENKDSVQLIGFGTFLVAERSERKGRNPKTNEPMTIPASRSPKFKPGSALKNRVNK